MSWTDKKISLPSFLGSSEKPKPSQGGEDPNHHGGASSSKSGAVEEPAVLMKAMLKKIKKNNHFTKSKLFVLYDMTRDTPAKLVYFDSEKKYLQNRFQPKREIILKTCLNINRRRDAKDARGQEFMGLDIYTPEDRLQISFDNREDDLNEWLEMLLILHQGATNFYGKKPLPNFEAIWQVNLKGFEPDAGNETKVSALIGAYRLGVTSEFLELFRLGDERGIKLHHPCIRKYMFTDKLKVLGLELGRTSPLGPGIISIESDEKDEIQQIHDNLLKIGRCAKDSKEVLGIPGRHRSSSLGQDRVPKQIGISHPIPSSRQPYNRPEQRNRTISEPVDGGGTGFIKQFGTMNLDSRYRIGGGRMGGVGSPTSPMGSTTGLSDGGTGSSSSINDPTLDFDPHISHQPEVIPEESSGEISIEFPGNSNSDNMNILSAYGRKDPIDLAGAAASLPRKSNRANIFHSKQPSLPDDYMRMDLNNVPPALPARNQEFNLSTSLPSGGAATSKVLSQSTASPTDSQPSNSLSSEYQGRPGAGSGTQHSTPLLSPDNPYMSMDINHPMLSTPPRSNSLLQSSPPTATIVSTINRHVIPSPRSSLPPLEGLQTPGSSVGAAPLPPCSSSTPSSAQPHIAAASEDPNTSVNKGRVRVPSGEGSYVLMSPGVQINLEGNAGPEEPASLASIEQALGGRWQSSPYHTSPVLRRSSSRPTLPEDSKRNSSLLDETDTSFSWRLNEDLDFTEDSDPRGMSPPGHTDDYMLIDYPRCGMGSTPRPISRTSPASSSSAMCFGTPGSVSRSMVAPDMDRLEKVQSFLMDHQAGEGQDKRGGGAHASSSSRPPRGDTSSGRSSKSGRYIDIPSSKPSSRGNMSFHLSGRTPPSSGHSGSPGVVSRIEGWFRNRAGSVPNRPQLNERRRHRTQSEGEKDAAATDTLNN